MTPLLRAAVLLSGLLAPAGPREPPAAAGQVEVRGGRLVASFDLAPAFPASLRKQLSNGLRNVVALHVSLVPDGGAEPALVEAREIEVLYDVWEEKYRVVVREPGQPRGRRLEFAAWEPLRAFLAEPREFDLAPVAAVSGRTWVVVARVEVNPVSQELLDRTRELIANPAAGSRLGAGSRSVLGTVASYLLTAPDAEGDAHLFRSAAFTVQDGAIR